MSSASDSCPICGRHFPPSNLVKHVNKCLDDIDDLTNDEFISDDSYDVTSTPGKRIKLDDSHCDVLDSQNNNVNTRQGCDVINPVTSTPLSDAIDAVSVAIGINFEVCSKLSNQSADNMRETSVCEQVIRSPSADQNTISGSGKVGPMWKFLKNSADNNTHPATNKKQLLQETRAKRSLLTDVPGSSCSFGKSNVNPNSQTVPLLAAFVSVPPLTAFVSTSASTIVKSNINPNNQNNQTIQPIQLKNFTIGESSGLGNMETCRTDNRLTQHVNTSLVSSSIVSSNTSTASLGQGQVILGNSSSSLGHGQVIQCNSKSSKGKDQVIHRSGISKDQLQGNSTTSKGQAQIQSLNMSTSFVLLADRMRPKCLDEFVGQDQVVGEDKVLRILLKSGRLPSMILWGPPGCGKVSTAKVHLVVTCVKVDIETYWKFSYLFNC